MATASKAKQQETSSILYHVKSHGVTIELTPNWQEAFSLSEELRRKYKSENVQLLTIRDARTAEQRTVKHN